MVTNSKLVLASSIREGTTEDLAEAGWVPVFSIAGWDRPQQHGGNESFHTPVSGRRWHDAGGLQPAT